MRVPIAPPAVAAAVEPILRPARERRSRWLLEDEALELATQLGARAPIGARLRSAEEAGGLDLDQFPGERVVVKALAAGLLHKSDLGAVQVVPRRRTCLRAELRRIASRLSNRKLEGFLVQEFVEHPTELGGQLLVGLQWTREFGPVVVLAPGGVDTELLSARLDSGRAAAVVAPGLPPERLAAYLDAKPLTSWITRRRRGRPAFLERSRLLDLVTRWCNFAEALLPATLERLEINPLVLTPDGPVALDAVARLAGDPPETGPPDRPLAKMQRLLTPRSIAVVGVSRRPNPGRIILQNILRQGFDPQRVWVIKPGAHSLLGCPCVPSLSDLPAPVDLLVVAIAASDTPELMTQVTAERHAESVILIPGGLGESPASRSYERQIRVALDRSRQQAHGGPLVNGGNCLGIRSVPGRFDTLFIPEHKLAYPDAPPAPLALISQSGAFAVAQASKLGALNPRYLITIGNQIDLTAADYLEGLAGDPKVEVVACYLEGFRPGDGRRWLDLALRLRARGRDLLLYRAGRTKAGAATAAAHTESVAGDYAVARELATAGGALVIDRLEDFEDLVRLACALRRRPAAGRRLAAISNAGFECVAMADHLHGFQLAPLGEDSRSRLAAVLREYRLETVVTVRNPLDLTPIVDDAGYEAAVAALLADPAVDLAVVGCVPLTGALQTLPAAPEHPEDLGSPRSVAERLLRLWRASDKPWVAVVDAGAAYDPLAHRLDRAGIPTFRSADRALRLLDQYWRWRAGGGEEGR